MFQEIKEDNLNELILNHSKVVVQYAASWCGNCRLIKPKFKRSADENENILHVIVDAEKFPNSRKLANVNNLPTFATFIDGQFVDQVQTNKEESLKKFIHETTSN